MDFPLADLMDEDACSAQLVAILHPNGLACPRCGAREGLKVHRRYRAPVLDDRCTGCGRVFNAFTGTVLHKTHYRPSEILLVLRGIAQGETTARLARELGKNRPHLLTLRHRLPALAERGRDPLPLDDPAVEADEMYQNAGEKRRRPPRPGRPATTPRQRAAGPRPLRQRPAAGRRAGGPAREGGPHAGGGARRRSHLGGVRAAVHLAGDAGRHRRVEGV
jgi:transposase-like protein